MTSSAVSFREIGWTPEVGMFASNSGSAGVCASMSAAFSCGDSPALRTTRLSEYPRRNSAVKDASAIVGNRATYASE